MEKYLIGSILYKRLKKVGYTYESFAEKVGEHTNTIKRYVSGERTYDYESLMKYAEILNCSYDYLLGYSESPEREYHEIKEQTLLSDESIRILCSWKEKSDTDIMYQLKAEMLDQIICDDDFLTSMLIYCATNRMLEKTNDKIIKGQLEMIVKAQNKEYEPQSINYPIAKAILLGLMEDIDRIKYRMSPELKEKIEKDLKKINRELDKE